MENTIENNKLIAEFMGYDGQHEEWCGNNVLDENGLGFKEMRPYNPDSNWGDIMPVVEKIESVGYYSHIRGGLNNTKDKKIQYVIFWSDDSGLEVAEEYFEDERSKIECIYSCVIQFIKWHNQNNITK